MKRAAADVLAQDRIAGDDVVGGAEEVEQELGQAARLGVLVMAGLDLHQERFDQRLEYRHFVVEGGVEGCVGFALEGEDPFLFASAHRGPALEGFQRRVTAEFAVAHHAPHEAVVRGRDTVVQVEAELGQGIDVDPELALRGNHFRQSRIQAVNALDDQDVVVCNA